MHAAGVSGRTPHWAGAWPFWLQEGRCTSRTRKTPSPALAPMGQKYLPGPPAPRATGWQESWPLAFSPCLMRIKTDVYFCQTFASHQHPQNTTYRMERGIMCSTEERATWSDFALVRGLCMSARTTLRLPRIVLGGENHVLYNAVQYG